MDKITELLPFLIPLAIVQFSLLGYTLYRILTRKTSEEDAAQMRACEFLTENLSTIIKDYREN